MKICQPHWEQLIEAIKERGLWDLVSSNPEHLMQRLTQESENGPSPDTYDPLFSAGYMITENALSAGGTYLLGLDQSGQCYCPLCELEKNRHTIGEGATDWIHHAADGALDYCRKNNLVSGVQ